ncbi:hypothetical protein [Streptantibioticus ferralitis]|uniref:Uncharacterized protein n=1 Tax=Streptantibioticus ferralitis TaxID=236510 RepID=A0ABT5YWS7_9ACTN|nr:hypothetical protein [Streptantibioticus ferralitis]MDF2255894.1 hypothetical protein [Streptantibioticus ferralitis]
MQRELRAEHQRAHGERQSGPTLRDRLHSERVRWTKTVKAPVSGGIDNGTLNMCGSDAQVSAFHAAESPPTSPLTPDRRPGPPV